MRAKPALCDPFETQDPGMNMSWETEQNKCDDVPTLDLIAARMWNCGVGELPKWSPERQTGCGS